MGERVKGLKGERVRTILIPLAILAWQAPATPRFEPVQPEQMAVGGALVNAWTDYDDDGDPDLFVGFGNATTPSRLYRNDKGTLVDVAKEAGIAEARATRGAAWGDFDADGDADLVVGLAPGPGGVLKVYRNDQGKFADVTSATGIAMASGAVRQMAWVDSDGDDDLDLFVAFRDRANMLFRNDRAHFADEATAVGLADARRSVGAVWFDYDEDGDLDLHVANMDGDANGLFRNDRGKFVDVARELGLDAGGRKLGEATSGTVRTCAADVDSDGRFDVFTANYGPNGLFLNRGKGRFEDVSSAWGVAIDGRYDTCVFADYDHDGRLDLYVNGTVTGGVSYRDYLFGNAGTRYEDVTPENLRALHADHGAAWVDFDLDGDVDLSLTGTRADLTPLVMRNQLAADVAARSLHVRVVDGRGRATRAGAEVRVFAAGTRKLLGAALVDSGSGYDAQNDLPVHIGLAALQPVDVEVTWPRAGKRVVATEPKVDPRALKGRALVVKIGS
jgi:hypothetical protein